MMKGRIKHVFAGTNTGRGFYSFYNSLAEGLERLFIIKGGPGTGKSTLIRKLGLIMTERGYEVEFFHCSSDPDSLDGFVVSKLKLAVIDGTHPHVMEPRVPGAVDEIINLGECWNEHYLREHRESIEKNLRRVESFFKDAYRLLDEARQQREKYIDLLGSLGEKKLEVQADHFIEQMFKDRPRVRHFFAGAVTPSGLVGYHDNLTADCRKRYFLHGMKSDAPHLFLKQIAKAAIARYLEVDLYHSAFDPEKLEMLIVPSIGVAVLDTTQIKSSFSENPGDETVDLDSCIDAEILKNKKEEIIKAEKDFDKLLYMALDCLQEAKKAHDEVERFYTKAMDFEKVDEKGELLLNKILEFAAHHKK